MSQDSLSQVTCMCCGADRAGMVFESVLLFLHRQRLAQDVDFGAKDVPGYICENCGAYVCAGCKNQINYSRWSAWNKAKCKQCGKAFRGKMALLPQEIGTYLNGLLEAKKEQDVVDLSAQTSKEHSESDVERMKRASDIKGLEEVVKSKPSKPMVIYAAMVALISTEERLRDGEAIPSIIGLLSSSNPAIRAVAAKELSRIHWDSRVVDALILALQDNEHPVDRQASEFKRLWGWDIMPSPQEYALDSLAKIGDRKGLEAMTPLALRYKQLPRGQTILTFFREIGEPVVEFLIQGLGMKDYRCRQRAADALRIIADPRATDSLIATLNDEVDVVRSKAAQALGGWGDERCIEPLLQVLTDTFFLARKDAKDALNNIISKHDDPSCLTERFVPALGDEDSRVRAFAAKVLGEIGDKRAIAPLELALQDDNRKVRSAASKALRRIEKRSA